MESLNLIDCYGILVKSKDKRFINKEARDKFHLKYEELDLDVVTSIEGKKGIYVGYFLCLPWENKHPVTKKQVEDEIVELMKPYFGDYKFDETDFEERWECGRY